MKQVFKVLTVAAFALLIVFTMTGCFGKNRNVDRLRASIESGGSWAEISENVGSVFDDHTDGRKITINGLTGITGRAALEVSSLGEYDDLDPVAMDIWGRTIRDNSVTFSPMDIEKTGSAWKGSGSYILRIDINYSDNTYDQFFYTNGRSWSQLGISRWGDLNKLPKYNIRSKTSTIDFNKFTKWDF